MKTLITKKTIIIAAAAVLVAVITVVSVNVFGSSGAVTSAANAVTAPLKHAAASLAQTFEGIYGSIYRYEQLKADYEKALQQIAELRRDYREYTEATEELQRLYALLGFRDSHKDFVMEPAVIRSWSASNWSSTFTISRGSDNSDVEVGDSIITEHGILLGRVTEVGKAESAVASVFDTTFSAMVSVGESGGSAAAKGDFSLMGNNMLRLDHIVDVTLIVPGSAVVTSGKGGILPGGLVIGEVREVLPHSTGIGYYATVSPLLVPELITHVYIITDFAITE